MIAKEIYPGFPTDNGADFSADRLHRFLLWRIWSPPPGKLLGFLMLNPSIADEARNDPTTVRNMARARSLGYAGIVQANVYSFRTNSPAILKAQGYPGGPRGDNALALRRLADACETVVLACGAHAEPHDFAQAVLELLGASRMPNLRHLGLTKGLLPRHPLHVAYATPLIPWVVLK